MFIQIMVLEDWSHIFLKKPYILKKVKDNSGNKVNISVTGGTQTHMRNELKSFILKDLYYDKE